MSIQRPLLALSAALILGGCGQQGSDTSSPGVVNVYSHRHYDTDQRLFDRFTEVTGIRVQVVTASADELITRLQLEGESSPADVLITVDAGRLHRAKGLGLLRPTTSAELEATIPAHLRDAEGYWFGLTQRARVIAYARDRVSPDQLSTYADLANPRWRGEVLTRTSENIYNVSLMASIIAAEGTAGAEVWARGVVANFARAPQGSDTDQLLDLAAGVGDLAIVNTYYVGRLLNDTLQTNRDIAARVGIFFPNQGEGERGTHVNVSGAGITTHAPNAENALRLIEFLVSEEAQRAFAEAAFEYPVREGVEWAPTLREWGQFRADTLPLQRLGELNNESVQVYDRAGWR